MNPLEKIKEGVEQRNWDLVCEGYSAMTGQDLPLPAKSDNINSLVIEVPFSDTTIQLFKNCMRQMIDEFEFVQEMIDKPDAKGVATDLDAINADQPDDDDEENVEFDAVTESVEKVGLFGNPTVLITEKPKQSQIEANQVRAANREEPRVSRPPPKKYKVKCTDCEEPFESRVKTGEFGQKCPKCLRAMRRDH